MLPEAASKLSWKEFLVILGPFWDPKWSHVGHQDAPKRLQEAAKEASPSKGRPPRPLKRPQDVSKTDFGWIFDGFLIDFW